MAALPQPQPSAAAAAGAAAAALLQRQLAADDATPLREMPTVGWTEHQTGDGRKFYFHEETQLCTWEKPEVLMDSQERSNDTKWREYKIWDGRAFYYNKDTKVSCWSMPPELRKLRGESSGIDDRPLPQTQAEKRRSFWEYLKDKGVDETWNWNRVYEVSRGDPQAQGLSEVARKQVCAEFLGFALRQKQIQARERDRLAASAFEKLVEERFSGPEDVATTYEEAAKQLSGEPAWGLIKSDVRRDEVFQVVMERMEEKHKKARLESRAARVVRLQRLMASDGELRRQRMRWKDVAAILARKDEMQEEEPPLEAMRVWASLRDLRTAPEHEAEAKSKVPTPESGAAWREDRKRRDAFLSAVKEKAIQGLVTADTTWMELAAVMDSDPKLVALQEDRGATAMELYDEFLEELTRDGPEVMLGIAPGSLPPKPAPVVQEEQAPARKRQRIGFSPAAPEPAVAEDDTNALDALIAGGGPVPGGAPEENALDALLAGGPLPMEEEEDPLMAMVTKAAAKKEQEKAAASAA